jgi:hypothetical protein
MVFSARTSAPRVYRSTHTDLKDVAQTLVCEAGHARALPTD